MIFIAAILLSSPVPVPVFGFSEGVAYLLYIEQSDGTVMLALSLDGDSPVTGYAPFPHRFNPAKTEALFLPGENTLEVVSQMPYSAVYSMATYRYVGESLLLVDSGAYDPYGDDFEEIAGYLARGMLDEALTLVDQMMYPQSMPNGSELCLMFLDAAFRCARSGGGIRCYQAADQAAMILMGRQAHEIIGPGETLPSGCVSPEDYNAALDAYAAALEAAGNSVLARSVREAKL